MTDRLNDVCGGWSTASTMTVSADPRGGIIDRNPALGKWFVIFNDARTCDDWFDTREDAVAHFVGA